MDKEVLKAKLADAFINLPQKAFLAASALESVFHGIDELAKVGFRFSLEEAAGTEPVEFPKMLYHDSFAPKGLVVGSQEEVDKLGPGWRTTPQRQEPNWEELSKGAPGAEPAATT